MTGIINKKTIIHECIAGNDVIVAGIVEADAVTVIVAGIVACYGVVAGIAEADAVIIVASIVVCYGVVAGIEEVDAVSIVVASIVACYGVVVRGYIDRSTSPRSTGYIESYKCNPLRYIT